MTRSPRPRVLLIAIAALSLLLAACSDDSEGGATDRTTTTTATTDEGTEDTGGTGEADTAHDVEGDDPASTPTAALEGEVATADPVPSSGCGTSTVGAIDEVERTVPETGRWFLLTTPEEHDGETPLPLVLDYHGLSEGAEIHSMMSAFGDHARDEGFVVVFPHGTGEPVHWDTALDRTGNPDMAYTDAVLDLLERDLCIDTSRVYATGLSNGAFMSSALACTMPDRIAAIAPVAGVQHPEGCEAERPVPVLAYHGTEDPILLFNGGVRTGRLGSILDGQPAGETGAVVEEEPLPEADLDGEGYPAAAAGWAEANGCDDAPTDEERTETVISRTWDCPSGAAVRFEILEGGGHSWPGSEFSEAVGDVVGATDMTIDATAEIWAFFQRFALPAG